MGQGTLQEQMDRDLMSELEPVGRGSAVDAVVEGFKRLLIRRKLKLGQRVPPENSLAASLGVSRGTVREAMRTLSAVGLVEIRRGQGTFVSERLKSTPLDSVALKLMLCEADHEQLTELRLVLEYGIIRCVLNHATADDYAAIRAAHETMETAVDEGGKTSHETAELDIGFHLTLVAAAHNHPLEIVYSSVLEFLRYSIVRTHEDQKAPRRAIEIHQRILEAIEARSEEKSLQAIYDSIRTWNDLW